MTSYQQQVNQTFYDDSLVGQLNFVKKVVDFKKIQIFYEINMHKTILIIL